MVLLILELIHEKSRTWHVKLLLLLWQLLATSWFVCMYLNVGTESRFAGTAIFSAFRVGKQQARPRPLLADNSEGRARSRMSSKKHTSWDANYVSR